jgi:hypothetical protein
MIVISLIFVIEQLKIIVPFLSKADYGFLTGSFHRYM